MTSMKKLAATGVMTVLLGVGTLVAAAPAAKADTVCNRYGDCWYVSDRDDYPARFGVRYYYYDNDWYWRHHGWRHHHWRHHYYERGYWRNGVWIRF